MNVRWNIGVVTMINLYSGLGCPRASYQESDVPYYGHIVSIIEQSSIMKNDPARIEVKTIFYNCNSYEIS